MITLIVKFIWLTLGLVSIFASFYAAGVIIRDNKRRKDEYSAYCSEVASNADQQVKWLEQGDPRGIYGPEAIDLMDYIRSGGATGAPKITTASHVDVPRPLSGSRQAAPAAVVVGGVVIALLLAQVDGPAPGKTPPPPTPTRTTINSPAPTQRPTTVTVSPPTIVQPLPSSSALPVPEPAYTPPPTTYIPTPTYSPPPSYIPPPSYMPPQTYAPPPALVPLPSAPYYSNCSQAHADGRYNIPRGDPSYRSKLDRDGDGYACE